MTQNVAKYISKCIYKTYISPKSKLLVGKKFHSISASSTLGITGRSRDTKNATPEGRAGEVDPTRRMTSPIKQQKPHSDFVSNESKPKGVMMFARLLDRNPETKLLDVF